MTQCRQSDPLTDARLKGQVALWWPSPGRVLNVTAEIYEGKCKQTSGNIQQTRTGEMGTIDLINT